MNLTFANPALLPLLALVAAPLLVHLFARSRPRHYDFSSTRFISEIKKRTSRVQRPRSWLLLILRTLLFLALIAMVLKPVLFSSTPLASAAQSKTVVILVDQSASMAAQDGARTRFSAATSRASEILSGLGANDVANVIFVKRTATAALPAPASNRGALQEMLRKSSVSMETPDWRSALGEARNQLKKVDSGAAGEVHIISDFQESNWNGIDLTPPENARLIMIQTAKERPGNQAIARFEVQPRNLLAGEEAEAVCEIINYSNEPVLRTVFLRVGETVDSREVRLPANARGGASFLFKLSAPGEHIVEVSLENDAFPYDDTSRAVVKVDEKVGIAISGSDAETAAAIAKALRAVEWFQVSDKPDSSTVVWILAGWDAKRDRELVDKFMADGGGVIIMPEAGSQPAELSRWEKVSGTTPFRREKLDTPIGLRINQTDHPVFKAFTGGDFGDPAGGRLAERFQLPPGNDEHIVLSYQDGVPAIAIWSNPSPFALWNIPLDGANASWKQRAEFVPLLAELVMTMRGGSTSAASQAIAGESLFREMERDVLEEEVELAKDSVVVPIRRIRDRSFGSIDGLEPGIYQWKVQGMPIGPGVVNFPAVESDLIKMLPPSAVSGEATQLRGDEAVGKLREGQPLWPYLLLLAILVVVAESLVVWRGKALA